MFHLQGLIQPPKMIRISTTTTARRGGQLSVETIERICLAILFVILGIGINL